MNIFFGKVSEKNPEQLIEGYYQAKKGSTWFNGIDQDDYALVIGGGLIQLWRAKNWKKTNGSDRLYFEKIISDIGIGIKDLVMFKWFQLNVDLIVKTTRSTGGEKRAFFPITFEESLTEEKLTDPGIYKNPFNFRQFYVKKSKDELTPNSYDIQLYHEEGKLKFFESLNFDSSMIEKFKDNSAFFGKGQPNKDKAIKIIIETDNSERSLYNDLTFKDFYDAYMCDYSERGVKYWAGGFKQGDVNKKDEFINNNYWTLGWTDKHNTKGSRTSLRRFKQIEVGDQFAIKGYGGNNDLVIYYVGEVIEKDEKNQKLYLKKLNKNLFHGKPPGGQGGGSWQDAIVPVTRKDMKKLIFETSKDIFDVVEKQEQEGEKAKGPLNQILYGPPGTGKTYSTINYAVAIHEEKDVSRIENECLTEAGRKEVQRRFKEYSKNKYFRFVTFHQSYSYEDFVEGIKPNLKADDLKYIQGKGIFKDIVEDARSNWENTKLSSSVLNRKLSFDKVLDKFVEEYSEEKFYLNKDKDNFLFDLTHDAFYYGPNWMTKQKMNVSDLRIFYENGVEKKSDLEKYPDLEVSALAAKHHFGYFLKVCKAIEALNEIKEPAAVRVKLKKYVLIIDEINRGNVSAIFGELITLLEDNKRLSETENISLTLPYSKQPFSIPPNLYIIGTMNTADRSVEALDTALRRRFSFTEMMPKPGLLKDHKLLDSDVNLQTMLTTINDRLELLIGRDHTIGHAFFMDVKDLAGLKKVFRDKVIPQLQEYFYGDWEKIGLVLGGSFIKKKQTKVTWPSGFEKDDVEDRAVWGLRPESDWQFDDLDLPLDLGKDSLQ